MAKAKAGIVPSPLRGLNVDVPVFLMQSGELLDCLNANYVNHNGSLGLRAHFAQVSGTETYVGKPQCLAEWVDENGTYRIVMKTLYNTGGTSYLCAYAPATGTWTQLGQCSPTKPGSLFVFGTDLYYVDPEYKWFYGFTAAGAGTLYSNVWGIGPSGTAPTITAAFNTSGALDPGVYRWCVVPYDSKRGIEGRRSPWTEPMLVNVRDPDGGQNPKQAPNHVRDATQAVGYRAIWDPEDPPTDYVDWHTGGANISWTAFAPTGRYDRWRVYRTAADTDFTGRAAAFGSTFSDAGVLVGEVASTASAFSDYGGAGNWKTDLHDQAVEEPDKCKLAVQYGTTVIFFSLASKPGGYEKSIPGRFCHVARNFEVSEGGRTRLISPHEKKSAGICPIPATVTAVVEYGGAKLFFTRSGLYRIAGYQESPTVETVDPNHGTGGLWAVAKTDYGLFWYDGSRLARYAGGEVQAFGTDGVNAYLAAIPAAQRDNAAVGYCSLTRELLVAYKAASGSTQYILSYDFARKLWMRYQVNFQIFGFFEANTPYESGMAFAGKTLYVICADGLWRYPHTSGETIADAGGTYATAVFGVEDPENEKIIRECRVNVGANPLKFTFDGYFHSADATNKLQRVVTMGDTEISNSFLLTKICRGTTDSAAGTGVVGGAGGALGGRYFQIKIEPKTAGGDWIFHTFDIFKTETKEL